MRKELRKVIVVISILIFTLALTGCGLGVSGSTEKKAKNYIEEKYGREAKVDSSYLSFVDESSSIRVSVVKCHFTDDGSKVTVAVYSNGDIADSYSAEYVSNLLNEEIEDMGLGKFLVRTEIEYSYTACTDEDMIKNPVGEILADPEGAPYVYVYLAAYNVEDAIYASQKMMEYIESNDLYVVYLYTAILREDCSFDDFEEYTHDNNGGSGIFHNVGSKSMVNTLWRSIYCSHNAVWNEDGKDYEPWEENYKRLKGEDAWDYIEE